MALNDYLRKNCNQLLYEVKPDNLYGVENINVNIQEEFRGKGIYRFIGTAQKQTNLEAGGYSEESTQLSGSVTISINCNGELFVESVESIRFC